MLIYFKWMSHPRALHVHVFFYMCTLRIGLLCFMHYRQVNSTKSNRVLFLYMYT
jgi:hypothetical protein